MNEVYVSYNGTLYVPYIAVYMFHGYTGTLYVAYMNALPSFALEENFLSNLVILSTVRAKRTGNQNTGKPRKIDYFILFHLLLFYLRFRKHN